MKKKIEMTLYELIHSIKSKNFTYDQMAHQIAVLYMSLQELGSSIDSFTRRIDALEKTTKLLEGQLQSQLNMCSNIQQIALMEEIGHDDWYWSDVLRILTDDTRIAPV